MNVKSISILFFSIIIFSLSISVTVLGQQVDLDSINKAQSLSEACYNNNIEEVKQFVERGVDVNEYDSWGWVPLLWACYYKNYDIVMYLLKKGADPNLKSRTMYNSIPSGSTALMMAAYNGHVMLVKLLLNHNADKKVINHYGLSALSYARNADSEETCNILKD